MKRVVVRQRVQVTPGMAVGRLVVGHKLPKAPDSGGRQREWWMCTCSCGVSRPVRHESLVTQQAKSCGCARRLRPFEDLTGRKMGVWTVLRRIGSGSSGIRYEAQCDCGRVTRKVANALRSASTASCSKSCGLLGRFLHQTKHELYTVWRGIIERCYTPTHAHFADYGGRGIRMHDSWRKSFVRFLADVGPRPTGRSRGRAVWSLDRIDVNGNYEPSNVRWATQEDQCANKRLSRETVEHVLDEALNSGRSVQWIKEQLLG